MICRALILDLDGTVLGPDEKISPAVVEAVSRVSGMIPVCIATGRERGDVLNYSNELGLSGPQMSDNGALILDSATGEALWSAPLGEHLSMRAMRPIVESGLGVHRDPPVWNDHGYSEPRQMGLDAHLSARLR